MTFTFRQAAREKIGLLFAIAGASGSGKTMTALKLAKGIANGTGRIAVIDTEAGRALHYAPKPGVPMSEQPNAFEFLHLDFQPPFTPERYVEAIQAATEAGATVIVVDSMSHEWAGDGGCADIQALEAERMAKVSAERSGKNWEYLIDSMTAPAWKKPKIRHKRMVSRLLQSRVHLIFCMRAEEKIKIVGGKVIPIGFQPVCEKSWMFEMSGSMTLHPETPGSPRYDLPHKLNDELRGIFVEGERIGDDAGKRLRLWAETGADRPALDKAAEGTRELIERIQDAQGEAALRLLTGGGDVVKQRAWLTKNRPELADRVTEAVMTAMAVYETGEDDASDPEAARIAALAGPTVIPGRTAEVAV